MRKFWIACIVYIFSFSTVHAAVWINEISPSTDPEWVELYNDGSDPVDLSNWLLEDGNTSHTDDLFLSGIINASGYIVISHSEGWLNNGGDTLKLYNNATPSAIVDQYTYETVNSEKTVARYPTGSENWVTGIGSQGVANSTPSPSPSASPSPTPTMSPSPTPMPTTTPTIAPTTSPTPKPSVRVTPSPSPELSNSTGGTVAGITTASIDLTGFGVTPSPSQNPGNETKKSPTINKSRARTALIVGSGLILISLAGFFGYRRYLATIVK